VDALLDPATPDVVRRRLPLVLKSCASILARDGLVQALAAFSLEVRLRCVRAPRRHVRNCWKLRPRFA
jgi:hypothetical protein